MSTHPVGGAGSGPPTRIPALTAVAFFALAALSLAALAASLFASPWQMALGLVGIAGGFGCLAVLASLIWWGQR